VHFTLYLLTEAKQERFISEPATFYSDEMWKLWAAGPEVLNSTKIRS